MDEFSLQEANRFQSEQVIDQEGVGVFESTDDTSSDKGHIPYVCRYIWGLYVISSINDRC